MARFLKPADLVDNAVPDPDDVERISDEAGIDEPGHAVGDRCPERFMQIGGPDPKRVVDHGFAQYAIVSIMVCQDTPSSAARCETGLMLAPT